VKSSPLPKICCIPLQETLKETKESKVLIFSSIDFERIIIIKNNNKLFFIEINFILFSFF